MSELNNDVTPLIFGRPKPESAAPPDHTTESAPAADDADEFGTSEEAGEQPAEESAAEAVDEDFGSAAEVYVPVADQPAQLWPGAAEAMAEPAHDQHASADAEDDAAPESATEIEAVAVAAGGADSPGDAVEHAAAEPAGEPIEEDLGSAAEVYAPVAEQPAWLWPGASEEAAEPAHNPHDSADEADEVTAATAEPDAAAEAGDSSGEFYAAEDDAAPESATEIEAVAEATGVAGTPEDAAEHPAAEPADEPIEEDLGSTAELYAPVAEQPAWLWPSADAAADDAVHDEPAEPGDADESGAVGVEGGPESAANGGIGAADFGTGFAHDEHDESADASSAVGVEGGPGSVADSGSGVTDSVVEPAQDEFEESADAGGSGVFGAEAAPDLLAGGAYGAADSVVEFTQDELEEPEDTDASGAFGAADAAVEPAHNEFEEPGDAGGSRAFGATAADDATAGPETVAATAGEFDGDDLEATGSEETAEADDDLWPDIDDEDQPAEAGAYGRSDVTESGSAAGQAASAYGHPEVDAVVERLTELDQLETADHIEVYEDAHHRLHAALLAAGNDEGSAADSSSDYA